MGEVLAAFACAPIVGCGSSTPGASSGSTSATGSGTSSGGSSGSTMDAAEDASDGGSKSGADGEAGGGGSSDATARPPEAGVAQALDAVASCDARSDAACDACALYEHGSGTGQTFRDCEPGIDSTSARDACMTAPSSYGAGCFLCGGDSFCVLTPSCATQCWGFGATNFGKVQSGGGGGEACFPQCNPYCANPGTWY